MTQLCRYFAALIVVAALTGCNRQPKPYPTAKTVTIICPWAAGGGTDLISRFWADALREEFGSPFVVVNRTGGSGRIGHDAGAKAPPDGYTITMITAELSTMHRMGISKFTHEAFEGVLQMNADAAAIIVKQDAPWQTLDEFLQHAKQHPGELKMSGTAARGTWDLARAGLQDAAGLPVDSILWIPTRGAAPSIVELLGGHIDAVCCSVPEAAPQIESGELRCLGVMAAERLADFPQVPTAREQGIDWVAVGWRGLAVPKGTPPEIVQKLTEKCRIIAESDAFRQFMSTNGFAIEIREADQFTQFLAEQDAQWEPVIKAAGYQQNPT